MTIIKYPKDKVLGGLWGLIIGDAVGVPYEFTPKSKMPSEEEIDIITPDYFKKTYFDIPFGTFSDDSSQFLCILDSYIEWNDFDLDEVSMKFLDWASSGLWAVDNDVFDIGIQTRAALAEFARGVSPRESGAINPDGKGNGALMRTLALALLESGSDEDLVSDSHEQCLVTHSHVCNQVCCAFYNLIARYLLEGMQFEEAYDLAEKNLKEIYKNQYEVDYIKEFEDFLSDNSEERGTGYVVDCLKTAFKVIRESNSYEEAIKKAISYGNDTDTTAAVTGGLAGIIYGFESIPERWYDMLRGKEEVLELIDELQFKNI